MSKSLKKFKDSITFAILFPLLILLVITSIVFYIVNNQRSKENELAEIKQIYSTNELFQSALSEKLAIVASSNVFIDFITSGELSRKEILPRFLEQLSTIHSNSILGLAISNTERDDTFNYGQISNAYITLKLCYLANRLDNKYGKCNYLLKIYFSNNGILDELKKINGELAPCQHCQLVDLFNKDLFGSFAIHDKSSFLIGLKTKESKNMIYYYYFFIIFLLIIFAVLNNARIHRLINNVIARPIQKLVKNVKTDSVLERSNQSLQEINYLIEQIGLWKTQIKASQEIEKRAVLLDLAAKVAHDIGSPIVVMETIVHSVSKDIPREDVAILHEALQSVRDIANNLLLKYRQTDSQDESNIYNISGTSSDEPRYILLFSLVKQVVVHKRQEWKRDSCEIVLENDPAAKFIWTKCNPNEIKRMLSNLLNNSYEALRETRRIIVKLKQTQDDIQLCIRDTGIGISQDMIENVLHGISLKHAGKGLGLSGAKTYMQSIGGNLNLISEKNKYTEVILNFPREAPPIWFPSKITIPHDAHIAILDDDPAIHGLWKHLFQNTSVKVTHFLNSEELINWHESIINESKQIVCLFDYELKDDIYNGLSMLKKLKIKNGYLVTSHAETFAIQETISTEGFWLLPKSLMGEIAIHY